MTTALFDLLREHDLTEISISELCRTAGVHRTTFYGHYADIYAFASDTFARMLDDLSDLADEHAQPDDTVEAVTAAYYLTMRRLLQHILDHRAAYRMMFGTRVDAGFRRDLQQRVTRHAETAIENWNRFHLATDLDPSLAAAFVAGGSVGVFEEWANSDSTDVDARAATIVGVTQAWQGSRELNA
ncbi:MAG: TetR-like C-terminal domain-containing protein [Herbiconiux sp.]|nr:TetR-like C-terminal domain-containing protein [Herbiconiux sp.]